MQTRISLANLLLIAGAALLLGAAPLLPAPAGAAPRASLTETAEPTVVTATPALPPTATPVPTATAVVPGEPTATPTDEPRGGKADPAVSKRVSTGAALVGDTVTFTILVTNDGDADAHDVLVEDELPAFLELLGANASRGDLSSSPRGARLFIGQVSPGDEVVLEVVCRVLSAPQPGANRNTVSLSTASSSDNPTNNSSSASLSITDLSQQLTPTATGELASPTPEAGLGTPTPATGLGAPTPTAPALNRAPPEHLPSTGAQQAPGARPLVLVALALIGLSLVLRRAR